VSQDIGNRLFQLAMTLLENYSDELKISSGSLGDFLIQKFHSQLKRDEYSDIDRETASQFLDFFQRYECLSNASSTWFDLSAEGITHYQWCEGDLYLNWKDKGFQMIFDLLMVSREDQCWEFYLKV
jgi:spermine oxidase